MSRQSNDSRKKDQKLGSRKLGARKLAIGLSAAFIAAAGLVAVVSWPTSSPIEESAESIILENGVSAPATPENKLHGWSTVENQVVRIEDCDEWDYYWVYQGPAVSSDAADLTGFAGLTVSTEHYIKNQHLDEDKDGVLCFFENQNKPDPSAGINQWPKAFDAVWSSLKTGKSFDASLDFESSPSAVPSDVTVIREGVEMALGAWMPYITSDKPISVTVVHPDDKDWFMERWESLGKGGVDEGWFDAVQEWGGGAAGPNPDGSISMYFMSSEKYSPPTGTFDFYYHEVTHVFESQWRTPPTGPISCWTVEGPASFFGFTKVDPKSRENSQAIFAAMRFDRAAVIARHFEANGGLNEQAMRDTVLNSMNSDETCQFGAPFFGYTLGVFIAEKFLIDFGMDGFVAFSQQELQASKEKVPIAFMEAVGVDYEEWVNSSLAPYLVSEITALTR
jgi:hypothetical protein